MDSWPSSSVTKKELEGLVDHGLLRPATSDASKAAEWLVPVASDREPRPPKGYVVSFISFHERGLGCLRLTSFGGCFIIMGWSSTTLTPMG